MEGTELIKAVVRQVRPLEAETLGDPVLDQIISGRKFREVDGGSHINLMDTISVVSCIATIVQTGLAVWPSSGPARSALPADFDAKFRSIVLEHAARHPELQHLLDVESGLLDQVTKAVRGLLNA